MLWLASLLGIVGVGATSLVLPHVQFEDDAADADDDYLDQGTEIDTYGNLMDAADDQSEPLDSGEDTFLLQEKYLADLGPAHEQSSAESESQASNLLRDIAEYPFLADFSDPETEDLVEGQQPVPPALGEWILEGPPAEVVEYEADKDSLMLVWDDLADGAYEPEVRVEQDPDDSDVMHVVMNDYSVAEVHGEPTLSAADVTIIPLSSALIVGLEPA